jgi:apolipoprotein N-acyltransferase
MVAEVPLVTGLTPALRFGGVIAAIWMLLGAAGVGVGILSARRSHGRP